MADRSFDVAVNSAYLGIREHEVVKKEYKDSRFEICKRQIALAGYRLADYFKDIFRTSVTEADAKKEE